MWLLIIFYRITLIISNKGKACAIKKPDLKKPFLPLKGLKFILLTKISIENGITSIIWMFNPKIKKLHFLLVPLKYVETLLHKNFMREEMVKRPILLSGLKASNFKDQFLMQLLIR